MSKALNWKLPFKDPLSQKDLQQMDRERAHAEEFGLFVPPEFKESDASRSIRVYVGYKDATEA
jgi:hypothetical protein